MKKFITSVSLATLLLAGCSSNADQTVSQTQITQSTENISSTQSTQSSINVTEMQGINGLLELKIGSRQLDELTNPELGKWEKIAKNGYMFEKTADKRLSLFVYQISDFQRSPESLFDFSMPQAMKDQLYTSDDPCAVFKNLKNDAKKLYSSEPYLPLDVVGSPVLCKSTHALGSAKAISLIGVEPQFEGLPLLGNMIMVVRKNDVVILSNLVPYSMTAKFNQEYQQVVDDYVKLHPDMEFPNDSFNKLAEVVSAKMAQAIQTPDQKLKDALDHLHAIAEGL